MEKVGGSRRSVREFVTGLKKQIEQERAKLATLTRQRDIEVARLEATIQAQEQRVLALEEVVKTIGDAPRPSGAKSTAKASS